MINGAAALAELIRPARDTGGFGTQRALPVLPALSNLLPHRGLRRGSTIAIGITPGPAVHQAALPGPSLPSSIRAPLAETSSSSSAGPRDLGEFERGARRDSPRFASGPGVTTPIGSGSTSLLLALLSAASSAGSWCAVVGVPTLGALAAAESGIALDRLALVPNPGPEWPTVVAALIDGVDVVVIAVPGQVAASIASRLAARARQRGCVLVPYGRWDGADVTLQVTQGRWEGLGTGHGRLRRRKVTVLARGRGPAAWPKEITMWMPGLPAAPPRDPAPGTTEPSRDPASGSFESPRDPAPGTVEPSRFRPVAVPPSASVAAEERTTSKPAGSLAAVPPPAPVAAEDGSDVEGGSAAGSLASVTPIRSAASASAGAVPTKVGRGSAGGPTEGAAGSASSKRSAASASPGRAAGAGCA